MVLVFCGLLRRRGAHRCAAARRDLHPQFIAEDGHVWFADAYNRGWFASLFRTQDGYYQTLPRLAAALALLVPLARGPLVMNLAGLLIQALPAPLLLSSRFDEWGSLRFRCALALAYLAMPNCSELSVTVTNAQWHLAFAACLLILARTPQSRGWRWLDTAVFVSCGLTGPFCILLVPIACAAAYLRPERGRRFPVIFLGAACAMQVSALLLSGRRSHGAPLGASLEGLGRIMGGQIYLGAVIGHNNLAIQMGPAILAGIAAGGTMLIGWWLIAAGTEMRLFGAFSLLVLAASLLSPSTGTPSPGLTEWRILAGSPAGIRYWFFPTLACIWATLSALAGPKRTELSQFVSVWVLVLMMFGFVRDWRHQGFEDLHFAKYTQQALSAAKPGEIVSIPLNPPGWEMRLVKR